MKCPPSSYKNDYHFTCLITNYYFVVLWCLTYNERIRFLTSVRNWPIKMQWLLNLPQALHSRILRSIDRVHSCVLYGFQKIELLLPQTDLNDWFCKRDGMCLLRATKSIFKYNSVKSKYLKGMVICKLRNLNSEDGFALIHYKTEEHIIAYLLSVCL
jgi:hypothetical protein